MAAPAKVSKRRSNFRIRQFKEKSHFNIAANLTLSTIVSFVLVAHTARIACADRHTDTHTHTHTRDNYCNPLCALAQRVKNAENIRSQSRDNYPKIKWMPRERVTTLTLTKQRKPLVSNIVLIQSPKREPLVSNIIIIQRKKGCRTFTPGSQP